MYQMKASSPKDSPKYVISKLLQNSLADKLGMDRQLINYEIVNPYEVGSSINCDTYWASGMSSVAYQYHPPFVPRFELRTII